jgi:hypothetical protein
MTKHENLLKYEKNAACMSEVILVLYLKPPEA